MRPLSLLRQLRESTAALITVLLVAGCGADDSDGAASPDVNASTDADGQGGDLTDAVVDADASTTDDTAVDDALPDGVAPDEVTQDAAQELTEDSAESDAVVDQDAVDAETPDATTPLVWTPCPAPGFAEEVFRLPEELTEVSGLSLASSGDFLWMHNDSGDSATLYGVDFTGAIVARWDLDVPARDWEDMALGLCDTDSDAVCVFIGDIGDNAAARVSVRVYRLPEPGRGDGDLTGVETMTVRYADGARDAEALYVDGTGRVGIMSKEPGETGLYVGAFEAGEVEWSRRATVDLSALFAGSDELLTAADYDPERGALIIRTYSSVAGMMWPGGDGPVREGRWRVLPNGVELQAEALAWGTEGYWHVAEGSRARVYRVDCRR
jgi:hypothetical protein